MRGTKEQEFEITYLNGRIFSSRKLFEGLDAQHRQIVSVNEQLSLMQPVVEIAINVSGPIRLIPIGDTHLYSRYTDNEAVKRTLQMLDEPNSYGFITGDFIEGQHPGISDHTGSVELDFGKQIVAAAEVLRPYYYAGKLLCIVDGYDGHEGWGRKNSGISAVEIMARLMPMIDLKDPTNSDKWRYLPVLTQGGLLKLRLNNGHPYVIKIFHNPNSGGSDTVNRQGGLKTQFLNADDDLFLEGEYPDMYIAGHQHHRAVVSKEIRYDRLTRREESVALVQIGTAKGITTDNQDPYLVAQGKGPSIGPGPNIVLHQIRGGDKGGAARVTKELITYGSENAGVTYDIASILHRVGDQLNIAERQNLTSELLEKIIDRVKKPVTEFDPRNSGRSPKEKPGRAPLYDDLRWRINNLKDFPALVYMLANSRYGSSSHEGHPYKEVYENVLARAASNPFEHVLVMRDFIDKGVARRFDRRDIIHAMANDLGPVNEQKRLLGIMMSSTLLNDGWQKDVVEFNRHYDRSEQKWVSDKEVDEGFRPGDELYYESAVKGVPLYVNESLLRLALGKIEYTFFLLDRLGRSGSEFNLVQGLVQSRKKEHVAAEVTAGGHMSHSGYSVYPPKNRVYLATGGFSNWDAGGKGNDKMVAAGGQAVILFPERKLVIPASSFVEASDIMNGLIIDRGLSEEEKNKVNRKRK
jgi:hypothetical protein